MTPQDKAKELVEKFSKYVAGEAAIKHCVLIAVEEILNLDVFWYTEELAKEEDAETGTEEFWQSVKTEIEKL